MVNSTFASRSMPTHHHVRYSCSCETCVRVAYLSIKTRHLLLHGDRPSARPSPTRPTPVVFASPVLPKAADEEDDDPVRLATVGQKQNRKMALRAPPSIRRRDFSVTHDLLNSLGTRLMPTHTRHAAFVETSTRHTRTTWVFPHDRVPKPIGRPETDA
jgi:hypothetical protein